LTAAATPTFCSASAALPVRAIVEKEARRQAPNAGAAQDIKDLRIFPVPK
jgi:hypothetical protein